MKHAKLKSIKQLKNLKNKRVLVRVDYNLPFNGGKLNFKEDARIQASLDTIKYLLGKGADVILVSHLGRPKGKGVKLSLKPVAHHLGKLLGERVSFTGGDFTKAKIKKGVNLLENIRFYKGEKAGDKAFARKISKLGDIFVNEAFSVSHRGDASVALIGGFLPAYSGIHLEQEIKNLSKLLSKKVAQPYIALLGGAKISTKINLIESFLKKADKVLLGGALISTILKYNGYVIGKTCYEEIPEKTIKNIIKSKKLVLPKDVVVGKRDDPKSAQVVDLLEGKALCKKEQEILDIGPKSVLEFSKHIKSAKTITWNGPMGYFENLSFAYGTFSLARLVCARAKGSAFAVVGGGETLVVLKKTHMEENIDWISTGGGAMLAYLAGEDMPGLENIMK